MRLHRDLKSALPSGISENFRRFWWKLFWFKVFRKWQDMMWITFAVHQSPYLYNETVTLVAAHDGNIIPLQNFEYILLRKDAMSMNI